MADSDPAQDPVPASLPGVSAPGGSLPPLGPRRRPVNARSVAIGLLGVVAIAGLSPYNDLVLRNTYLIGNFMPVGLLLMLLLLVVLVNAPLHRWRPALALSAGELAVVLGMVLVSCGVPSSGVIRYLVGQLVAPWYHAGTTADFARLLQQLDLPQWMFPTFRDGVTTPVDRAGDPVIQNFIFRAPANPDTFAGRWDAVPWGAWLTPALAWSIPVGALLTAVLCLSIIVRRQWVENERLAFPLADVYLALVEPPKRGHALNALLRSHWFWLGFGGVFLIHGLTGLNAYNAKWPIIPINYDLRGLFVDPPWSSMDNLAKSNTLYFCVIGITYYLRTNVALSLWLSFVLVQVALMLMGSAQMEMTGPMQDDQRMGMLIPFALTTLWIGRQHWALVVRHMFGRPGEGDSDERYLPYVAAGWLLVGSMAVTAGWLWYAGATPVGAVLIVLMCVLLYLVVARVVAETGLIFVQVMVPVQRPFIYAAHDLPAALATRTTGRTFYYAAMFNIAFVHDQRESLAGYAPNALRVADDAAYAGERNWRRTAPFVICLAGALIVAFVVGGTSMLYTEYAHAMTLDEPPAAPLNAYAIETAPRLHVLSQSSEFQSGRPPRDAHDRWTHVGIGAGLTTLLSVLRLKFVNWPLHPVGYLLCFSYPMRRIWFSIFVGWLAKIIIVRIGGAQVFSAAKPVFTGMILGEACAAAVWLIVCLVRSSMGLSFKVVNLLPG